MARPQKFRLTPDEVLEPQHARKLAGHVSEIELFRKEIEKLQQQVADIYDAADEDGFDKKFVRKAVAKRAKDSSVLAAEEQGLEAYEMAIEKGMATRARERNPKNELPDHDPSTGEITEPQPAPQAESDLTDPEPSGQVATNPEAKASEDGGATVQHIGLADDSVTGDASRASDGAGTVAIIHLETASEGTSRIPNVSGHDSAKSEVLSATSDPSEFAGSSNGRTAEFDSADAGSTPAPASIVYPAPGVVVMEHTPPEPVRWHPYANCFPTVLGEYLAELEAGIHTAFGGVQKPIVKIGNLILDGRARYGIARSLLIDYPVVQYDGTDPLMDVIAWNIASRGDRFTDKQRKATAEALCKLEPTRADEIMQAFGLEVVEAAE